MKQVCQYCAEVFHGRVLRPGGWVQIFEIYFNIQSDSGQIAAEDAPYQWSSRYMECMDRIYNGTEGKKKMRKPLELENDLRQVGFSNVRRDIRNIHLSPWDTRS